MYEAIEIFVLGIFIIPLFLCPFMVLGAIAMIAWSLSKSLLTLLIQLTQGYQLKEKNSYKTNIIYVENMPVWVTVEIYLSYENWSMLKHSSEFKQIEVHDILESIAYKNKNFALIKINFCLSFDNWNILEKSKLFNAIIKGAVLCEERRIKFNQ